MGKYRSEERIKRGNRKIPRIEFSKNYIIAGYVLIMPIMALLSKGFLTWNNHGLSHVRGEFVRLVVLAAVRDSATTRLVSQALCRHHERPVPAPAKSTRNK